MKLLLADPSTGGTKSVDIDDDYLRKANLGDYRMGQEIDGRIFGDAFDGYSFRITGGQDKDGFPMKQGVMTSSRVRLLLTPGTTGFQKWRARKGERKRRSVRGCILGIDLATLALVVVKKGEREIEGLTDVSHPLRLGPKRANKIRKLFGLTTQDVRKYVVRRTIPEKEKDGQVVRRAYSKAPKIQRLIVPAVIRRRKKKLQEKKERVAASAEERKAYISLILSQRRDERLRQHNKKIKSNRHSIKKQAIEIRESRQMASEKQRKASAANKTKSKGKK